MSPRKSLFGTPVLVMVAVLALIWPAVTLGQVRRPDVIVFDVYDDGPAGVEAGREVAKKRVHWTNWMEADLVADFSLVDKTAPMHGETCVRMTVKFAPPNWCGIAASCKENYWGEEPCDDAFDLREAGKLVFYARGDKGGEVIKIEALIAGDKRYGDSSRTKLSSGPIRLERDWRRHEVKIDPRRHDLRRVVIPFSVVAVRAENSSSAITFYLDRIYYAR